MNLTEKAAKRTLDYLTKKRWVEAGLPLEKLILPLPPGDVDNA